MQLFRNRERLYVARGAAAKNRAIAGTCTVQDFAPWDPCVS
jgi:hypothetical protein